MSCLSARVTLIPQELNASVKLTQERVSARVIDAAEHLRASVGLLCGFVKTDYLNVRPTVVWLTPENLFTGDFDIESNVEWEIE